MKTADSAAKIEAVYQRLKPLVESLPSSPAVAVLRRELLGHIENAVLRRNVEALKKLYRETRALAQSLGVQGGGQIDRPSRVVLESSENVIRRDAGPGLTGWGRRCVSSMRRVGRSGPAREHAPLQYPYGDPPTGWETGRYEITTAMPDSQLSEANLARIRAFRSAQSSSHAAEDEACQRHGQVRYHGEDEPPEYYWPDDPE